MESPRNPYRTVAGRELRPDFLAKTRALFGRPSGPAPARPGTTGEDKFVMALPGELGKPLNGSFSFVTSRNREPSR